MVDEIEKAFQSTGIIFKRDIREIDYKGSIKEYMKQVRETDFVLLIISDEFLKSSNAMFEVLELIKDDNYKKRILPILIDGTKIFTPQDRINYIRYWSSKYDELSEQLRFINNTDAIDLLKLLKHYESIKRSIDEFLGVLTDMSIPKQSELNASNYNIILRYIGADKQLLIKEILAIRENESDEEKDIIIDKLEERFPNNSNILVLKAIYAFNRGHISKSSHFYRKAIQIDPSFGSAYYNLGFNVENYEQNYDEARSLYEKAIELEPFNTKAYSNLAILISKRYNEHEKAKAILEKALSINEYDAVANFNLGLIFQKSFNDFESASKYYQKAIEANPKLIDAKHNYAMLLWEQFKKYSAAKDQFEEIIEIDPMNKITLKQLGLLVEKEYNHHSTAKMYFDRFINIEPNDPSDHTFYSSFLVAKFGSQYKSLAKEHYEKACSMDSSSKSELADSIFIDKCKFK